MLIALTLALSLQATPAPSPQPTQAATPAASASPASTASPAAAPQPTKPPRARMSKSYKKLAHGTLTGAQIKYALTHQLESANKLRAMHSIKFENLRVYKLSASDLKYLHADASTVAYQPFRLSDAVAQSGVLGSFLNLIANVNVSNALNGSLNGNTVNASLSDVLNGNNIAIGQVVGVYVNGGGIITTLITSRTPLLSQGRPVSPGGSYVLNESSIRRTLCSANPACGASACIRSSSCASNGSTADSAIVFESSGISNAGFLLMSCKTPVALPL
jgi:hypothetical protein